MSWIYPLSGPERCRLSTPTICAFFTVRSSICPMIERSDPKMRLQYASVSTTTGGAPFFSSSDTSIRPSCGYAPNIWKKFAVTRPPVARCGSPRPSTLKVQSPNSTN